MKKINWYTNTLVVIALLSFLYSISHINTSYILIYLSILVILMIVDSNPIQLPSGDFFQLGTIVFLLLMVYLGFQYAVISILLGTTTYFLVQFKTIKIPYFQLFATCGMYIISLFGASIVWEFLKNINIILAVTMATISFEVLNIILFEGIMKTVNGEKMFKNWKQQAKEIVIPIVVGTIIIIRILSSKTDEELLITIVYMLFFLLILIVFSKEYIKQLSLRKSTTQSFIQVLESSITPSLSGHGNRVGIICEHILQDLAYPKKKRNELVQAAFVHDIGKALLPAYIFRKRGDLSLSEELEYKSHPEKAVEIVKTMFPKENFSRWILHHHERFDGKGFPHQLKGEKIPLEARIIALCNEIDHLLTQHEDNKTVMERLTDKAGTILDPSLVSKLKESQIGIYRHELGSLLKIDKLEETLKDKESAYINRAKESIGKSSFGHVRGGVVWGLPKDIPTREVLKLSDLAIQLEKPVHETVVDQGLYYDIYTYPYEQKDETIVFIQDITPTVLYRQKLENKVLKSYEDVIHSLSKGKVDFHSNIDSFKYLLGDFYAEMRITVASDLTSIRAFLFDYIQENELIFKPLMVQLAISEATSNLLKHATGGTVSIYKKDEILQVLISDNGSGIPLHEIPKTILVSGFSSKNSLGKGFHLMSTFSDKLHVHTSSIGTSILMEFYFKNKKQMSPV